MKHINHFLGYFILFVVLNIGSNALYAQTNQQYILNYTPLAKQLSQEYKIPVAIILGIAVFESDYGRSKVAKRLNNHFGIEGHNHHIYKTRYRYFANVKESYIFFCKMITKRGYYINLKGNVDYGAWIKAMSKSGYSEMPEVWAKRLNQIIKNNKLNEL
ncbi:MAG: muramidase [Chitinophagaceae bacterium]|nr:muramidase [Chitinophagaceae bacterium]